LRRDEEARTRLEKSICDPQTCDGEAAQLAGYLVSAQPLSQATIAHLSARLGAHLSRPANQPALKYTPMDRIGVRVALLAALDASASD
jgi:hypothetical protein